MNIELTTQIEPSLVPTYLDLEYEAAEPYYDFVYDDEAEARRAQRILWDAGAGEWVPPHGHAIMRDREFVGLIGGVTASDLPRVRLRASMALGRAGILSNRDLAERMRMAVQTLVKPEEGDFYYGHAAITVAARKTGVADEVFDLVRRYAYGCGARRSVFQARADSPRLVAFYERSGQRERIGEGEATDPKTGRKLHYIHFATDLAKWQQSREAATRSLAESHPVGLRRA